MEKKNEVKSVYMLYQQSSKKYVEVSKEVFMEFHRYAKRERYVLQKEGKCVCPQSFIPFCDCDCDVCPHHVSPAVPSKEQTSEQPDSNETTSLFPDPHRIEEDLDSLELRKVLDQIEKIYPIGKKIIILRYYGYSDHEIERMIGIPRRTFEERLKTALKRLGIKAVDFR